MAEQNNTNLTLDKIAEKVGVSIATVSRVLNGKGNDSNAKHRKIAKLLTESGYQRKQAAGAGGTLLLILGYESPAASEHATQMLEALERACNTAGFRLVTVFSKEMDCRISEVSGNVDYRAVLTVGPSLNVNMEGRNCPKVALTQYTLDCRECSAVDNDDVTGHLQAMEKLVSLGHRRIAFFSDQKIQNARRFPQRDLVFTAYERAGLEYDPALLWEEPFADAQHDKVIPGAVDYFLNLPDPPTAIILSGDCYAPCFYTELAARGISVPQQMSIVGYSNSHLGELVTPKLTSSAKDFPAIAAAAINIVRQKLIDPSFPNIRVTVDPYLVTRDSIAPPPQ